MTRKKSDPPCSAWSQHGADAGVWRVMYCQTGTHRTGRYFSSHDGSCFCTMYLCKGRMGGMLQQAPLSMRSEPPET